MDKCHLIIGTFSYPLVRNLVVWINHLRRWNLVIISQNSEVVCIVWMCIAVGLISACFHAAWQSGCHRLSRWQAATLEKTSTFHEREWMLLHWTCSSSIGIFLYFLHLFFFFFWLRSAYSMDHAMSNHEVWYVFQQACLPTSLKEISFLCFFCFTFFGKEVGMYFFSYISN